MTETAEFRPMIFNPPMVQAILGGYKTVTRRLTNLRDQSVVKAGPETLARLGHPLVERSPPCCDGDILWVREKWSRYLDLSTGTPTWRYAYFADGKERVPVGVDVNGRELTTPVNWKPSIHMPKDAARLFLRVVNHRVERLQSITVEDAQREGVDYDIACELGLEQWMPTFYDPDSGGVPDWIEAYRMLWDNLRKPADRVKYGWDANPWVWWIEFQRCEKPDGWTGEEADG